WLGAGGLSPVNTVSVPLLASYGQGFTVPLNGVVTAQNIEDRRLLRLTLSTENATDASTLATKYGVGVVSPACTPGTSGVACASLPYSGYPTSGSLRSTLVPFPQYNGISPANAPLGYSWYDSLQISVTQRLTHGLTLSSNFTYAKTQSATSSLDPFNS